MQNEMRDRLIELLKASVYGNIDEGFYRPELNCESVADHLIANGVILPPCKVGDNIYFIERHPVRLGGTKINIAEVLSIKAKISYKCITFWLFVKYRDINGNDTCGEIMYGRTAFKTEQEAREALKGGEHNA